MSVDRQESFYGTHDFTVKNVGTRGALQIEIYCADPERQGSVGTAAAIGRDESRAFAYSPVDSFSMKRIGVRWREGKRRKSGEAPFTALTAEALIGPTQRIRRRLGRRLLGE